MPHQKTSSYHLDVASDSVTVEVTGDEEKINSLLELLRSFGIRELARTGRVAMTRGNHSNGGKGAD